MKNIKLIQTIMLSLFLIGIVSAAGINTYYNLNLNYDRGKLTLISNNIDQSRELINNSFGLYSADVLDYGGNLIGVYFFDIPLTALYDNIDENGTITGGGEMKIDNVNLTLFIPYYDNATKIVIYDENETKKLEIDVSYYSKNYEEYKEYNEFNNIDSINQNISNEEVINNQNNESGSNNITKEETPIDKVYNYWWILLIILIILVGIIINYVRK